MAHRLEVQYLDTLDSLMGGARELWMDLLKVSMLASLKEALMVLLMV